MVNIRNSGHKHHNRLKLYCERCNREISKEYYRQFEGWRKKCFMTALRSHLAPEIKIPPYQFEPDWFEQHMKHLAEIRGMNLEGMK